MHRRVAKFAVAGAISTVFSMFSFPIIYEEIFGRSFFNIAYILSCIFNVGLSFSLQRYFVFQSKKNIFEELFKFILAALLLIVMGYVMIYFFVEYMNLNLYVVNIAIVATTAIASFFWHKLITFGAKV